MQKQHCNRKAHRQLLTTGRETERRVTCVPPWPLRAQRRLVAGRGDWLHTMALFSACFCHHEMRCLNTDCGVERPLL